MGKEEQVEEREVLDSIFPDEIIDTSENEYRISITLDVPDDDSDPPVFFLNVRYPDEYPDKEPLLDLAAPQNAPSHPHFAVAADKERLLQDLNDTIQENMGMAMVFSLVTTLKEAAEQLIIERKGAVAAAQEEALLAAEREENKKFHGTPVTRETFLAWRDAFVKEMEEQRQREEDERLAELKKAKVKEPVKLSGRQLWERGLAGKADEEEEEEENMEDDAPTDGLQNLKVGGA